jgi:hydrogenase maturation factor
MIVEKVTRDILLQLSKEKKIYLEGNILKLIKAADNDTEFNEYLTFCKERDNSTRKKRLEVTKQVQNQNKELEAAAIENETLLAELKVALNESELLRNHAEEAKRSALDDLDLLQRKTQFELIGTIVKVALYIIIGVGITATALYAIAIIENKDTTNIGSTWSNMFGILLTNAFSIVGTIMGVKYASKDNG